MTQIIFNVLPIEINILSNAIIIDNETQIIDGEDMNKSRVAWANVLSSATLTASNDQDNVDNVFDYMTTTFWNAGTGVVTLDIVLAGGENIDCAAITAGNWADAATVIEVYSDAGVTKVGEVSGLKNGASYYFDFDPVFTAVMQIKFTSVNSLSVGQVLFGESLKFPVKSSIGLELGKFNNKDKVINQTTENNAFGANSTVARSRDTISPFNLIPIDWINNYWVNFSDSHLGRPIWFAWNAEGSPADTIYGHWTSTPVRYTSSFLSELTLTIKGNV